MPQSQQPNINLQIAIICLSISGLYFVFESIYFLIVAGLIAFPALLSLRFRLLFVTGFDRLMKGIGRVKISILLMIVYFAVLTPLAILYRLFNKKTEFPESRFVERNHKFTKGDLEKMW